MGGEVNHWPFCLFTQSVGDWGWSNCYPEGHLVEITLPETNAAPETLDLEDEFPFGKGLLPGAMFVLGSVGVL